MKVVFDTNVYVSAFLIPGSQGERAFTLARRKSVFLYSSVLILTETARVLRTKFDQPDADIRTALKIIARATTLVRPSVKVTVLADTPDNRILECAVEARADLIVTGDRHMLEIKKFEDIGIVRLADFVRMFPAKGWT
jgi:putative PIN family toxin of toxin-antitoxin system